MPPCPCSSPAVVVFNLTKPGNVLRAILGDGDIGTSIGSGSEACDAAPAAATKAATASSSELSESDWEQAA